MEVKDKHGRTPLHYACQNGHTKVVKFLYLDCKCNKNATDHNGVTPIFLAMINGRSDIMDILKEEQEAEDLNIRNVSTLKLNTPNTILLLQARAAVIRMLQRFAESEDASERYIVTFLIAILYSNHVCV